MPIWLDILTRLTGPALAALFTGAFAWTIAKRTIRQQRLIARRRATIDFIEKRKWDADYLTARQAFILLRDDKDRPIEYWADPQQQDRPERTTIRNILNDYELMAVGIREDIFDESLYRQWWKSTLLADWQATNAFIEAVQSEIKPQIYSNFRELADAWNEGRDYYQKSD